MDFAFVTVSVEGQAADAVTGAGIAGATILYEGAFVGSVTSTAGGAFSLTKVFGRAANLTLTPVKEGFGGDPATIGLPPSAVNVILKLYPPPYSSWSTLAFGQNSYGQLGDRTENDSSVPVPVWWMRTGVLEVGTGWLHSLAVKTDGTAWAWGANWYGQLGDGQEFLPESYIPVQVANLTGVAAVAGGLMHSLAAKTDGTVWAWGHNKHGQVGDGSVTEKRPVPVQAVGLSGMTAVAAGDYHCLALCSDGAVWAWGQNMYGQLGNGTFSKYSAVPVRVAGLSGVIAVAAGNRHSLALRSDGTVWAWGDNSYGQLGNGSTASSSVPVQVRDLTGCQSLAAGGGHALASRSGGTAWAWGSNSLGQLGNGTTVNSNVPVQVVNLAGVKAVSAGSSRSFAVLEDGNAWAWGSNFRQIESRKGHTHASLERART